LREITSKYFPNAGCRSKSVIRKMEFTIFSKKATYYLPSGWDEKLFKASEQDVDCNNEENLIINGYRQSKNQHSSAMSIFRWTNLTMIMDRICTDHKNATNRRRNSKKLICIMRQFLERTNSTL